MQDLSEIHLLPEELEEYSRFSRMMKLLKKLRLKRQAERVQADKEVIMMQQAAAEGLKPVPVAPSATGLKAAPVASQPEPINQVAVPKPVNATLEPLTMEKDKMSTRVAAAKPNNPFERMMLRKFAALGDDGTPSLEEAAGLGLLGVGGAHLGGRMSHLGSGWMAQEALGSTLGPDFKEIKNTLNNEALGRFGRHGYAMDKLRAAALEHGLERPSSTLPFLGGETRIMNKAKLMEKQLADKLTKSKRLPFKGLGALAGILGGAALIKNMTGPQAASAPMAPPAEAGFYPEAQMTDMGGQYPGAY